MTLWIILTLLTALAAVIISIPFIRRYEISNVNEDQSIQVGRDQLAELKADVERGLIDTNEAATAKTEIERRILSAAKAPTSGFSLGSTNSQMWALTIVVGWVVVGATGLYVFVGRPDLPSQPFVATAVIPQKTISQTAVNPASNVGEVGGMIAGLEARLAENPDDAEGWRMLGWSYFNTEKYDLASKAYEKSVALDASNPAVLAAYGETLVRAQKGLVSEKAQSVFDDVLALNPSEPRARFFKGMALEQSGNSKGAIELWLVILDDAPANADWVGGLEQRVQELAAATGYDLGGRFGGASVLSQNSASLLPPKIERGPTQEDINAAQSMTTEDRQAMIVGMVDQLAARLEDDPSNVDDWVKLMRSRLVLKDTPAALSAYNRASEIFADQPVKLSKVTIAAQQLGLSTD